MLLSLFSWFKGTISTTRKEKVEGNLINVTVHTFVAEGESLLFPRLNTSHPNVIVVDEPDEAGVTGADLGVHTCAWILARNLCGIHRRSLGKKKKTLIIRCRATSSSCGSWGHLVCVWGDAAYILITLWWPVLSFMLLCVGGKAGGWT